MNKWLGSCVALLLLTAAPATAQTVSGDWDVTIVSPQGANTVRASLKQDGEKITGVFKSPMGELPFENGTLTGDELKISFTIPVQGQQLEIRLTGKVETDGINGKADFGGFAEGDWSAKRAPAETAAATAAPAPAPATTTTTTTGAPTNGVSGRWDVMLKTTGGDLNATVDLVDSAGNVTGTMTVPRATWDVAGTFDGTTLKLDFIAKTSIGEIPMTMNGDLNGDSMSGRAIFNKVGTGEWTAKRVK